MAIEPITLVSSHKADACYSRHANLSNLGAQGIRQKQQSAKTLHSECSICRPTATPMSRSVYRDMTNT
jgi:hypothetical protein